MGSMASSPRAMELDASGWTTKSDADSRNTQNNALHYRHFGYIYLISAGICYKSIVVGYIKFIPSSARS